MCGIAGIYFGNKLNLDTNGQARIIQSMTNRMVHRGPDADGVWVEDLGRCALGHRRLSIIDVSDAGKQPMHWNNGEWVISFNGEIYNFREIKRTLEQQGVMIRGRTDTEVLLAVLATWGVDGLSKLDGMFAFAAFHQPSGQLILARDPFGEKPLYFMELDQGGLAFASELQCLEEVPGFDAEICSDAMAELLMFQYIGAPRSIYKNIKKLPPGHYLVVNNGQVSLSRYFAFQPGLNGFSSASREDLADELEDILVRSLERRLISDVPLGAFLSGGVDSSTVCALARRKLNVPLRTFSMGFEGAEESEHEIARLFAQHLGTEHSDQIIVPHVQEFLQNIGHYLDEPNGDSSCLPTYLLSKFARQSVTVALSGDGGDELFGGYGRYFETLQEDQNIVNRMTNSKWNPGEAYYSARILVFTPEQLAQLFGTLPNGSANHFKQLVEQINIGSHPLLCRLRQTDVENYMPGAVLPKVDRMSMQHSLEVRTPFLNAELAKFAEKVPPEYLVDRGKGKLLLRDIAYRYLPRELIDLPKKGFGLPLADQWGRNSLISALEDSLSANSQLGSWIGNEKAQVFLNNQRSAAGFSIYQVWTIVLLEQWLRTRPAKLPDVDSVKGYVHVSGINPVPKKTVGRYFGWYNDSIIFISPVIEYSDEVKSFYSAAGYCAKNICELIVQKLSNQEVHGLILERLGFFEVTSDYSLSPPDLALIQGLDRNGVDLKNITVVVLDLNGFVPTPYFIQSLRTKQASGLVVQNLHDVQSGYLYYQFRYFSVFKRLVSTVYLKLRSLACWKLMQATEIENSNRLEYALAKDLMVKPSALEYYLFESFHQLPPIVTPLSDIDAAGGGRYSLNEKGVHFSKLPFSGSIGSRVFPWFFLVPASDGIKQLLPITVKTLIKVDQELFYSALNRLVSKTNEICHNERQVSSLVLYTHGLSSGGAERQWCNLANGFHQIGLTVTLVVNTLKEGSSHYLHLVKNSGIAIIELDKVNMPDFGSLKYITEDSIALFDSAVSPIHSDLDSLSFVLSELKPDAVVCQLDSPNITGLIASLLADIPKVILSFRNYNPSNFSYLNNSWFLPCYKTILNSDRVILTGNSTAGNADYANWLGIDSSRIHMLPNSMEETDFKAPTLDGVNLLRNEFGLDSGSPVILGVFRLSDEKDPLTFVDVCQSVLSKVPGAVVLLVGEGAMESIVKERIDRYGLGHAIKLVGRRQNVADFLSIASVLLLTSRFEGTPNVVMEAMVACVPVVATRAGALPDLVIDGQAGFIREIGDTEALAECCVRLLTDPVFEKQIKSSLSNNWQFPSKKDAANILINLFNIN